MCESTFDAGVAATMTRSSPCEPCAVCIFGERTEVLGESVARDSMDWVRSEFPRGLVVLIGAGFRRGIADMYDTGRLLVVRDVSVLLLLSIRWSAWLVESVEYMLLRELCEYLLRLNRSMKMYKRV